MNILYSTMKKNRNIPINTFKQKSIFEENVELESSTKIHDYYKNYDVAAVEKILRNVISLSLLKGIGFHSICVIFDAGIINNIWEMSESEIQTHIGKHPLSKRLNVPIMFEQKEQVLNKSEKILNELRMKNVLFILKGNQYYPKSLLKLNEPPRWIFVRGNPESLSNDAIVGIVGTRNATSLGLGLAYQCACELAKRNAVVLSGLARGIDESAHKGAIRYFGQSIAILGYGLFINDVQHDSPLAEEIIKCDGAIVSEYLPYDIPSKSGFLRRNELQAALSNVIVPIEFPSLESGTGATIRRALKINTPVIGIIPEHEMNNSLQATKQNLEKMNRPVFVVRSENSREFWNYLSNLIPEHDWSINMKPGQERLFTQIINLINSNRYYLSIDEDAVKRLFQEISSRIFQK